MDLVEFAAARGRRLSAADSDLREHVVAALTAGTGVGWATLAKQAGEMWLEIFQSEAPEAYFERALADFIEATAESLSNTSGPADPPEDAQVDRVLKWLGTYTVNSATYHGNRARKALSMVWVSQQDGAVREDHRRADGQRRSVNGTFDVGGHRLRFPGEPVGPPEIWINCRCLLAGGRVRSTMSTKLQTMATEDPFPDEEDGDSIHVADGPEVDTQPIEIQDEELVDDVIDEIPVHGVAAIEGKPTGDGRMFARDALTYGTLPAPLGYEFESSHGGGTSRVATIGRIDEFWKVDMGDHVEVRYRGVIMPAKEYALAALEGIIDGSFTGLSVKVDDVTLDVTAEKEAMRARILEEQDAAAGEDGEFDEPNKMTPEQLDAWIDEVFGDGTMPLTTFASARIRNFDMVNTGAYMEAWIAVGEAFADELSEDDRAALVACGCASGETADHGFVPAEIEDAELAGIVASASFAPGTKDGPGWITNPKDTARIRRYWTHGKGAAKIRWGQPGDFNRCRKQLAKYVQNPEWLAGTCANMHKEALGIWPGQEAGKNGKHTVIDRAEVALVASAGFNIDAIPRSMFANPNLTQKTQMVVEADGHIYGHLAEWTTCHIGMEGVCTSAPSSPSNYAYFLKGVIDTDEGPIAVGNLTYGVGHASLTVDMGRATAHYDRPDAVRAYVVIGEDAIGIWFAGILKPGLTKQQIFDFKALGALSGDWRYVGRDLELIGATAVNTPGFPLPSTGIAASAGRQTALIAAGIVMDMPALTASAALDADLIAGITRTAVEEYRAQEKKEAKLAQVAPFRQKIRAERLAAARAKIPTEES